MDNILRLKKSYRNEGASGLLLFLGLMVFSVFTALSKGGIHVSLLLAGFGSFVVALSAIHLLSYYRESLSVQEDKIVQTGIIHRREMPLSEVISVHWRTTPVGGSVVLRSLKGRIKVTFDNFEMKQRRWLIRSLRLSLPQSMQENWERFCVRIALPLLKQDPAVPLQAGEILVTRQRVDRFFLLLTVIMAAVGGVCAWLLRSLSLLALPITCLPMWLLIRFSTPRKGRRDKKLSAIPERGFLLFLLVWVGIGMATQMPLANNHPRLVIGTMLLWFAVLLYQAYRVDHHQKAARDAAVPAAIEEWERLERATSGSTEERAKTLGN